MASNSNKSRSRRPSRKRRYRTPTQIEISNRRAFHEAAHAQRCCQKCGGFGAYQSHHVVEKSELKRRGRSDLVWDTRNAMRLCPDCHERHTNRSRPIELRLLSAQHFEFAFFVLGVVAHSYLGRLYIGEDPRLDEYLARWEEEHGEGSSEPGIEASV